MRGRRSLKTKIISLDPEIERSIRTHKSSPTATMDNPPPLTCPTLKEYYIPSTYTSPSCIDLPEQHGNFEIRPNIIAMPPNFHGLAEEDPYRHLD